MIIDSDNNLEVTAQKRDASIPVKVLRHKELLPVILYGKDIKQSIPLSIPLSTFEKLYKQAGETTIIDLKIEDEKTARPVLVKDLQLDPVTSQHIHVDLYEVKAGEKLRATVPLVFTGESLAVKDLGGILITTKNEIEVECLPKDLPKEITLDLSVLIQIDDSISIKDLKIPADVDVLDEMEDSVVVITPPAAEEELEEPISEEEAVEAVETGEEKLGQEGEEKSASGSGEGPPSDNQEKSSGTDK